MNTSNSLRYFLYARKSTDDLSRQVRSIDDQIAEIRELAQRLSLHIVDVLIEKQTAKIPGRPVFNEMLARIERGEADGIVAWHPDRLSRNSLEGGKLIYLVDIQKIKDLKFVTYQCDPTAQGKLSLAIAFGLSKYYVDNLSENILRGKRQKVKNGLWPGWAPMGYLNDKKTRGIIPDPQRSPLVRKAFELYSTGSYTLDELTKTINELGLIGLLGEVPYRTRYHHMLQNPIYYGVLRYKGELYPGQHEPIITKELFDKVQKVLAQKSKAKTPKLKRYIYRGMFRCGECGCFITSETQKGHNYLRCTKRVKKDCSQPYVREQYIGDQITTYLHRIALPETIADELIDDLQTERNADTQSRAECVAGLRVKMQTIDQKSERLMEAYLDQTLTHDEYRQTKAKLVNDRQELKQKLERLEMNQGDWFEPAIRFVRAAKSTVFLAETGTAEEKRDFLKKVGSNLTISDRHLSVMPRGAWQLVVDQGSFAQPHTAPPIGGAVFAGKTHHDLQERRGRESIPLFFASIALTTNSNITAWRAMSCHSLVHNS